MKRVAWLTDLHLEFLEPHERAAFAERLALSFPEVALIGGDTGIASSFIPFLQLLETHLQCPIYFVLGNHDFYHGSIKQVRALAEKLDNTSRRLHWLTRQAVVPLTEATALVGHDSWADGRLGSGSASQVELNDYFLIKELAGLSPQNRFKRLAELGDEAAEHFRKTLPSACAQFRNVLLLTHVPPFREACWHAGKISDDEYLPHFACKAAGEALLEVMRKHPDCKLTVLCGHTHSSGSATILPNLHVKTGSARYGHPKLQATLMIE